MNQYLMEVIKFINWLSFPIVIFKIKDADDPDFIISYANVAFKKGLSKSKMEIIGQSLKTIVPDYQSPNFDKILNVALSKVSQSLYIFRDEHYYKIFIYHMENEDVLMMIEDLTDLFLAQREIKANSELYRQAIETANDIIFDYYPQYQQVNFTKFAKEFSNFTKQTAKFPSSLVDNHFIHADDEKDFLDLFSPSNQERESQTATIRILANNQQYYWCKFTLHYHQDNLTNAKIIGTITNINDFIEEQTKLKIAAESDYLTGIYNKRTFETLVSEYLSKEDHQKQHALFLFDVDNFKEVNDCFGHILGDELLSELTKKIVEVFRKDDIIGRVGGDEFMVFMKNVQGQNDVNAKAEKISSIIKNSFLHPELDIHITISIGIALYPNSGTDFKTLYQNADNALYDSKAMGKDKYHIFDPENDHYCFFDHQKDYEALVSRKKFAYNVANQVLRQLSQEPNQAIENILSIVISNFDFHRASIYVCDEQEKTFTRQILKMVGGLNNTGKAIISLHEWGIILEELFEKKSIYYPDISQSNILAQIIMEIRQTKSVFMYSFCKSNDQKAFILLENVMGKTQLPAEKVDEIISVMQVITLLMDK
ncbi:MAG: diguanylate cyclase [Bacilli bacterium]